VLNQARHSASCSAEGVGGSIAMAVASLTPTAYPPSSLVPSQLRTIAHVLWRSQTPSRRETAFCASSCSTHTCDYFSQPPQQEPEPQPSLTARNCQIAGGRFVTVELRQDCAR
jgi:hypothetical protein